MSYLFDETKNIVSSYNFFFLTKTIENILACENTINFVIIEVLDSVR
jgi:hypothetical protein